MINKFKKSIRAKFTLTFIGILSFSCIASFGLMYLFQSDFMKSIISDISSNYTNEQVNQIHQRSILIMSTLIICVIIGSILMFFATKTISKPIKYISNITKEVSKGNFDISIDYESTDEIGTLAKNFNLMIVELKNMEYLRKDFISNVSHEFKTPISSIQGFVEMIKNKDLPEEKRDAYIDIIIEETERLSNLSSNMLRISRLDNQSIPNKITEFSLDEKIRKVILLLEDRWDKKNLELDINLESVMFKGDEDLIEQVWINLIENAIKFSEDGGKISVELKNLEEDVVVKVSDTGIGISEESKERVFERFYQGETSHSKVGNGLGLAIVKRIIEICRGEIEIESCVGKGTIFIIRLPKYFDGE
ncbi:HAMP domain-containing sensor histidine kinase [Clostridium gasigenes]|uniref:HAMP domain-containing sensor histidine kinase n=1 Tax=Clostridium gasigenes TaxID=94869 RepID=UPI001623F6D9|nr:HAMP domain-containing sensor histidine kinase [Clostridium gasigenes]MBB6625443.1 HAMP domain-containing histidine kinase [Clostridium gasigenes]MBU3105079.1 HAMP domain-containing histidine kinase [Clostridium gasigenes]